MAALDHITQICSYENPYDHMVDIRCAPPIATYGLILVCAKINPICSKMLQYAEPK